LFSGSLSDYLRRRKVLAVIGYGLSALTKPLFPLAQTVGWVFGARLFDRIGKGIRGAPRDALVAEIVPDAQRGAAYGLRQALDSVGAFLGPVLAMVCLGVWAAGLRTAMWIAVVPAVLAVVVLVAFVHEPRNDWSASTSRLSFAAVRDIPRSFWLLVFLGVVFTLARFSEAFLVLRARDVGMSLPLVPLVFIAMNVAYAGGAYPAGRLADKMRPRILLLTGIVVLIASDVVFAMASDTIAVLTGSVLWGVHMALTQGLFSKLVADTAPAKLRGTAFGVFHLATGLALLVASGIAGGLWSMYGAAMTFWAGAVFSAAAAFGLLLYRTSPVAIQRP
jgi:MFS family permease